MIKKISCATLLLAALCYSIASFSEDAILKGEVTKVVDEKFQSGDLALTCMAGHSPPDNALIGNLYNGYKLQLMALRPSTEVEVLGANITNGYSFRDIRRLQGASNWRSIGSFIISSAAITAAIIGSPTALQHSTSIAPLALSYIPPTVNLVNKTSSFASEYIPLTHFTNNFTHEIVELWDDGGKNLMEVNPKQNTFEKNISKSKKSEMPYWRAYTLINQDPKQKVVPLNFTAQSQTFVLTTQQISRTEADIQTEQKRLDNLRQTTGTTQSEEIKASEKRIEDLNRQRETFSVIKNMLESSILKAQSPADLVIDPNKPVTPKVVVVYKTPAEKYYTVKFENMTCDGSLEQGERTPELSSPIGR